MREGTFLGYKVDADGLRVSPNKVKAVLDLPSKDVQKLNGKLASLNRFLSKSAEKSLPFFKTLKKCTKKSDFQWTPEAEGAFKEMKQSIAELPMLTTPKENKKLIIYLAAAKEAISAVLMTERDGKQVPIYFVSRALQGPEINYTRMEKLTLAFVSASKRLKRYFQAHTIVVITNQPIKQLLSNLEVMGRLLKWRFELGEHDIQYRPRTSVKGQILADFIVERPEDDAPDTPMEDKKELLTHGYYSRTDHHALTALGPAEYEALIAGLRIASQMGIQNLQANVDSKLVANQVNRIYIAKESSMIRGKNKKTDALSKIASTSFAHLSKQVLVEELKEKAIDEKDILAVVEEGHTWMTPVYEYLTEGMLPEEKKKARTANYVLREIHEGSCSMHAGPRSVVAKALRSGYFWPTMHTDARNLIRECKDCQVHHPVPRNPQEKLIPITSPWPFYKWGIDIARPFPEGPGKSSNGETLFSLTYGAGAVEIGMPTLRTAEVDMVKNNEALGISLDLLEEKREQAAIKEARKKSKMEGYYNARVRSTSFRPRDFVYRSNEASHAKDGGKLAPKWEGPYEVTEAWAKEHTGLETAMDTPFREHGTSATLKSVIRMKCKHPFACKAKQKKDTVGILFVLFVIYLSFLMIEKVKPSYLHPF
nr:reverse transcriptase domain-containing protein [Tanacetum cinerariifolium]